MFYYRREHNSAAKLLRQYLCNIFIWMHGLDSCNFWQIAADCDTVAYVYLKFQLWSRDPQNWGLSAQILYVWKKFFWQNKNTLNRLNFRGLPGPLATSSLLECNLGIVSDVAKKLRSKWVSDWERSFMRLMLLELHNIVPCERQLLLLFYVRHFQLLCFQCCYLFQKKVQSLSCKPISQLRAIYTVRHKNTPKFFSS